MAHTLHFLQIFALFTFSVRSSLTTLFEITSVSLLSGTLGCPFLIYFSHTYHYLVSYMLYLCTFLLLVFSIVHCKLHKDQDFGLSCSVIAPQLWGQCLAHKRHSVNIQPKMLLLSRFPRALINIIICCFYVPREKILVVRLCWCTLLKNTKGKVFLPSGDAKKPLWNLSECKTSSF